MTSPLAIFLIFLRLGCTSFGGPIAHLGYFRAEFVNRRKWLSDGAYADVLALSQFVPGPASSQTGFALGVLRGGLAGGAAAWAGFTTPSALLMFAAAYGLRFAESPAALGLIHGLKLLAVAIVAQAVWSMGRSLCPDRERAGLALTVAALLFFSRAASSNWPPSPPAVFSASCACGRSHKRCPRRLARPSSGSPLFLQSALSLCCWRRFPSRRRFRAARPKNGGCFLSRGRACVWRRPCRASAFARTVVKPGWTPNDVFLAGYGAAQALPGPLFSFAAFLGAKVDVGPGGAAGAGLALVAIYLPGLLLMYGALPFWDRLRTEASVRGALNGVNATVVGILGAALYQPVWTPTVLQPRDAALALLAFAALAVARLPVLAVVALAAAAGIGTALL